LGNKKEIRPQPPILGNKKGDSPPSPQVWGVKREIRPQPPILGNKKEIRPPAPKFGGVNFKDPIIEDLGTKLLITNYHLLP